MDGAEKPPKSPQVQCQAALLYALALGVDTLLAVTQAPRGFALVPGILLGLFLAGLLRLPVLLLLALAGGLAPAFLASPSGFTGAPLATGLAIALQPLVAAWILRTFRRRPQRLVTSFYHYLWLLGALLTAGLAGALVMPLGQPDGLLGGGLPASWVTHWLTLSLGPLLTLPAFLSLWPPGVPGHYGRRPLEWLGWGLLTLAVMGVASWQLHAIYLLMPLLIWAATRFPLKAFTLVAMAVGTTALLRIIPVESLLAREPAHALLEVTLLFVMLASSLYIRILLTDRQQAQRRLEETVEERTHELQTKNFELQDEIFVRQQAERSFRRSTRHYRALVETASSPIIVVDESMVIRQWNRAAETLFGCSRDDAVGRSLISTFIPEAQQDEMAWKIKKILSSGTTRENIEAQARAFDGSMHHMLWNMNPLRDEEEEGASPLVILIGQDITDIRVTQDELHYLAHYDVLTGTANRRLFEDRSRQAIESALRYGHQTALITLDVDHFKRINDTLGHDAGDLLLKTLASRLREGVRAEDTISRMGGDEFAVLLTRVNGAEGCEKVARNLLHRLTQPIRLESGELVITSSIGITLAPDDGTRYQDLLKNADMAMYRAKKQGRNNIQFFSADMNEELQRQLRIEREMRQAMQDSQLTLYYQPVFDVVSGRVAALEALLRWNHPERGLLHPWQFLEVAEQSGLLVQLGQWVCDNVGLQGRAIQAMNPEQPIPVSLNLSARQYHHPQLLTLLENMLAQTHIPASLVAVEVDERVLSERLEEAIPILERIKALGIKLVLDRFGSGLSSVRLLREMPFDQVKIDRSLLRDIPQDHSAAAIVATLLDLARQMGMAVVANGVENDPQYRFLQENGCRLMQGHRFCEAIPSAELPQLLEQLRQGLDLRTGAQIDLLQTNE